MSKLTDKIKLVVKLAGTQKATEQPVNTPRNSRSSGGSFSHRPTASKAQGLSKTYIGRSWDITQPHRRRPHTGLVVPLLQSRHPTCWGDKPTKGSTQRHTQPPTPHLISCCSFMHHRHHPGSSSRSHRSFQLTHVPGPAPPHTHWPSIGSKSTPYPSALQTGALVWHVVA